MKPVPERLVAALADRYRIEREIGAGGMATVYLAEDLKHRRKVAIKVLREDLAASLGASRFLREIEIAAQLQHPNILPLLDSGDADGFLYYVMPFVEGQSLRDRINREGELPLQDAVRLLAEVADALAHAHDHGVVHRDIKPDNVMLSGRHALVADFGVAKAVSEATGRNTITTLGVAVGTPTYMSPEQAAADPHIDHRSDIYAVGVMAYELLAGRAPFTGATPQQVLAAHVTELPDPVSKRRPGISPNLEYVVMRCLEKRPADRFQSAHDLVAQLEPLGTPSAGITPTNTRPISAVQPTLATRRWPLVAAGVVVLTIGAFILLRPSSTPVITLGQATQVTADAGVEIQPSLSPDGKFVAYAAGASSRMRIFVRPVAGGRTIALTDDTTEAQTQPRFSRNADTVLFLAGGGVQAAPALGGAARPVIAPVADAPVRSATWSPDGREVAFVRRDSLFVRTIQSGAMRFVAGASEMHSCSWSPNGALFACVSGNLDFVTLGINFLNTAASKIVVIPAAGGAPVPLTDSIKASQSPVWSQDGRVLYFVSNAQGARDIYAVGVASSGHASGQPVRLTTGLDAASIALSADGTKIGYAVYTAQANIWSLPIPSGGPTSTADATQVTSGSQAVEGMRVSLDGKWLLYDSNLHGNSDLFRLPIAGGEPQRLTTDPADEFQPDLSPDGKELTFHTMRSGSRDVVVLPLDGGPMQVVAGTAAEERNGNWSPDGHSLLYFDRNGTKLYMVQRAADGKWEKPVMRTQAIGATPRWLPDGKWLMGNNAVNGSGAGPDIVLVPVQAGDPKTIYAPRPGTTDPAAEVPGPSPDGKVIYFKSHDAEGRASLWSIPVTGGTPRLLVRFDDPRRPSYRGEWAADGKRFYFPINDRQGDIWVMEIGKK